MSGRTGAGLLLPCRIMSCRAGIAELEQRCYCRVAYCIAVYEWQNWSSVAIAV